MSKRFLSPRQLRSPGYLKHKGFCRYIVGASRKEIKEVFRYAGAKIHSIESWGKGHMVGFKCKTFEVNPGLEWEQYPDPEVTYRLREKLGNKIRPYLEWPK